MLLGQTTKVSHQLTIKVPVTITFHKEKYLSYYQTDLNQIFFKNDDADIALVTFMYVCRFSFLFRDDSLFDMVTPHKPAIYLRFTASVFILNVVLHRDIQFRMSFIHSIHNGITEQRSLRQKASTTWPKLADCSNCDQIKNSHRI